MDTHNTTGKLAHTASLCLLAVALGAGAARADAGHSPRAKAGAAKGTHGADGASGQSAQSSGKVDLSRLLAGNTVIQIGSLSIADQIGETTVKAQRSEGLNLDGTPNRVDTVSVVSSPKSLKPLTLKLSSAQVTSGRQHYRQSAYGVGVKIDQATTLSVEEDENPDPKSASRTQLKLDRTGTSGTKLSLSFSSVVDAKTGTRSDSLNLDLSGRLSARDTLQASVQKSPNLLRPAQATTPEYCLTLTHAMGVDNTLTVQFAYTPVIGMSTAGGRAGVVQTVVGVRTRF